MNYSVFKLQNQGGKPSIFWEKDPTGFPTVPLFNPDMESIQKKDRKFGYKHKGQRFPVRRYAGDTHTVETDMVALTPENPQPPPKPAKNFIKRNRQKLAPKKEPPSTVTLTQEQLNAILKSVGKVASGSENAVKISIGENSKDFTIESPRRKDKDRDHDDDDDLEDERDKRRSKKKPEQKEEGASIYALLGGNKSKANRSDSEDNFSEQSIEVVKKSRRHRQERKPRRDYNEDDEDLDDNRNNKNRKSKPRKKFDDDDDDELKIRRDHSKSRKKYEDDDDDDYYERNKKETKTRKNRSKTRNTDEDDDDYDNPRENRRRKNRSKKRDDSYDDDDYDNRDNDTRERVRKSTHSKERKDRSRSRDALNDSETKDPEEVPSPRDKIGLPNDLSWRHMTKAERRRLEMARQRFIDEEERRDGERKQEISRQLGISEHNRVPAPTSRTRPTHGRDTQSTDHTDITDFRRHRRSRSPEDNRRSRTPDRSSEARDHHSPESSPKAPLGVPRRHMTLAEKKRIEWERDRVESSAMPQTVEPWGRPGAGAPLRSRSGHVVADYKGRQDQLRNSQAIQEEEESRDEPRKSQAYDDRPQRREPARGRPEPPQLPGSTLQGLGSNPTVPHAMRSSFVLGQGAPDRDMLENTKEQERKQWLADLEKQIEEKRMKEVKNTEVREEGDTWASKLGVSHRALPFPDQPKDTVSATGDFMSVLDASTVPDSQRVSSAPETDSDMKSHIRGQNVPIDPVTKRELEDKRQKYLDHQLAIKAQVEEKERLKRVERERKMKEDMEEEKKLQDERDFLKRQFESEQQKLRQKEAQRQAQVNQLKAAMDEAQAKAMQDKYQRQMDRLEAGGHDTSKLREHLEAKVTPRTEERAYNSMLNEPMHVPGLDLSTARTTAYQQQHQQHQQHPPPQQQQQFMPETGHGSRHEPYTSNRVLTPSRFRHPSKPWSDPASPRREFATQTGNLSDSATELDGEDYNQILNQSLSRDDSDVNIEYRGERERRVRVISAPKEATERRKQQHQQQSKASRAKSFDSAASKSQPSRQTPPPSQSYREQMSPHQHHHEVRQKKEQEEVKKRQKLEKRWRGPVKPGTRPRWGAKNPGQNKAPKQSEKDPFYEQKKRQSERRRLIREQKLLAMVERNKEIIPEYYVPAERAARSRDPSPFSDFGGETPREVRIARRSKSHSPNRLNSTAYSDYLAVHNTSESRQKKSQGRSPIRERSPSPSRSRSPGQGQSQHSEGHRSRGRSPPVPAIKHRNIAHGERGRKGGKYKDGDPLDIPVQNGEFVPFTRTIDVLDPANAEEPMPLSREATRVANARKAYYESLQPDKFGNKQGVFQDRDRVPRGPEDLRNPIFNPALVTDHPSTRQGQILMQLSTLKQSLMQRQRELETFSPTDLEKQASIL